MRGIRFCLLSESDVILNYSAGQVSTIWRQKTRTLRMYFPIIRCGKVITLQNCNRYILAIRWVRNLYSDPSHRREKVILHSDIEFTRNYLSLVHQVSSSFIYSISVTRNTNLFVLPLHFLSLIQEIVRRSPKNCIFTIGLTIWQLNSAVR